MTSSQLGCSSLHSGSVPQMMTAVRSSSCAAVCRSASQMFGVWTLHMRRSWSRSFPCVKLSCLCVISFRWLCGNLANMLTPASLLTRASPLPSITSYLPPLFLSITPTHLDPIRHTQRQRHCTYPHIQNTSRRIKGGRFREPRSGKSEPLCETFILILICQHADVKFLTWTDVSSLGARQSKLQSSEVQLLIT